MSWKQPSTKKRAMSLFSIFRVQVHSPTTLWSAPDKLDVRHGQSSMKSSSSSENMVPDRPMWKGTTMANGFYSTALTSLCTCSPKILDASTTSTASGEAPHGLSSQSPDDVTEAMSAVR